MAVANRIDATISQSAHIHRIEADSAILAAVEMESTRSRTRWACVLE